jgi:hypothetical protein
MIVLVRYSVLAWLWLLLLGGHALSAQEPVARPAFGRVLWVPQQVQQDVAALREVRRAGFNGVNLARGVEPGQAVAAGLGYYLDQPMGKGLLELRDEPWQGVAKDYEQHRNPAVLVRPTRHRRPGTTLPWTPAGAIGACTRSASSPIGATQVSSVRWSSPGAWPSTAGRMSSR